MRQPHRFILVLIALLAPPAAPASAERTNEAPLGFAIAPIDGREGRVHLNVRAGEAVSGGLEVSNPGRERVRVVLRRQDAGTAATGGLQYMSAKPNGTGRWLKLQTQAFELAPGASRTVRFTARVPDAARAGDHFAGIVAYNAADLERVRGNSAGGGVKLNFISRFAIAVQYRVEGDAAAEISAGDTRIETTPSGADLVVDLRNTGSLLVPSSQGRITVSRDGKELFTRPVSLAGFIPGTAVSVRLPWAGTPAEGDYHVTGFVHPAGAQAMEIDEKVTFGRGQTETLEQQSGELADRKSMPWWAWVLVGLMVVAAVAMIIPFVRWRCERDTPPVAPAAPVPRPPAPAPGASPIDVNTATADQLQELPGVSPNAAERIVAHRDQYGGFRDLAELADVEGFDAARVAELAGRAVASGGHAQSPVAR